MPTPCRRPRLAGRLRVLAAALALAACACQAQETSRRPPSAVLITLDTTRADALGSYGAPEGITPVLDRIAAEGITYEQARTVAPLTLPAHASMLTGLYPPRHGARDNGWNPLAAEALTLAELAREEGLATAAFVAAMVLDEAYGLDQGFDVYRGAVREEGGTSAEVPALAGHEVAARAAEWIRSLPADRGFFLWVHLFDPHFPLTPPKHLLERAGGNRYLAEVSVADAAVGRLRDALVETGALPDTFIAVVGDHGEGRGDHGEPAHGVFVYDSTLRVPFLLRYADGYAAGTRSDEVVSVVDVYPTLLDALRIASPADPDGISLYRKAVPHGRGAYFESFYGHLQFGWAPLVGWVDRAGKYLHAAVPEYYDVRRDPREERDLAAELGDHDRYRTAIAAVLQSEPLAASDAVAPQMRHQLEQLGYATAGAGVQSLPDPLESHQLADPRDRRDEAAAFNRALTAASLGRLDVSARILAGILEGNPDNPAALHYLAAAFVSQRRCPQALLLLARLEATGRLRPEAATNYGTCLLALERPAEAVAYFQRAIALDPGAAGALAGLETARAQLEP